ncbi:MAG TPA: hypothetical protein VLZ74_15275 [Methylocella sp.]|nr:hypothetical protein [Methylocella sp.]
MTRVGTDSDAVQSESLCEILYEFGLGSAAASFGIRTADQDLVMSLDHPAGQHYQAFMGEIGGAILRISPTRIVRNPIGRIEVFAPIPPPGGRSPLKPHTHFLQEQLKQGGDIAASLHIPDSCLPCFIYYPHNR